MTTSQLPELVVAPSPLAYEQSKPGDEWEHGLTKRYKVTRRPNIYPPADGSIQKVIQDAANCVQIISNAIKNVNNVIDKPNSREVSLVCGNTFTDHDIDSVSMHIMTALVHRCVVGYCGTAKEEAKGDDMGLNCLERLNQIVRTLTYAKSVCRDVLYEDCKIALLAHQPITSFRNKTSNQRSNKAKRQNLERDRIKAQELDQVNALTKAICNPYMRTGNSLPTQPEPSHPAIHDTNASTVKRKALDPDSFNSLASAKKPKVDYGSQPDPISETNVAVSETTSHNATNEAEWGYHPINPTQGPQPGTDYTQWAPYEG
jgi:hypothetical protein